MTHCPGCGCELAPKDPEGFPLAPQHERDCATAAELKLPAAYIKP